MALVRTYFTYRLSFLYYFLLFIFVRRRQGRNEGYWDYANVPGCLLARPTTVHILLASVWNEARAEKSDGRFGSRIPEAFAMQLRPYQRANRKGDPAKSSFLLPEVLRSRSAPRRLRPSTPLTRRAEVFRYSPRAARMLRVVYCTEPECTQSLPLWSVRDYRGPRRGPTRESILSRTNPSPVTTRSCAFRLDSLSKTNDSSLILRSRQLTVQRRKSRNPRLFQLSNSFNF